MADDLAALADEVGDFEPPRRRLRGLWVLGLLLVNLAIAVVLSGGQVQTLDGTVETATPGLAIAATLMTFLVSLPILAAMLALPVAALRRRGGRFGARFGRLWLSLLLVAYGIWTVASGVALVAAFVR